MNILLNKIKVGKKFVAVLRCQYDRRLCHPIDFFAVFFAEAKVIELLRMSCGKNMFLGPAKTITKTGTGPRIGSWEPVL